MVSGSVSVGSKRSGLRLALFGVGPRQWGSHSRSPSQVSRMSVFLEVEAGAISPNALQMDRQTDRGRWEGSVWSREQVRG